VLPLHAGPQRKPLISLLAPGNRVTAATIDDHLSALAHHYTRAANGEKAVKYLRMAGMQASKRSAPHQAEGLLVQARSLAQALPKSRERLEAELAVETELGSLITLSILSRSSSV
jgi:triphosphoribosyl-dephospho-CoA synthetase